MLFGQTFAPEDLGTVGLLVLLEGTLSVDNALVLGVLASRVPRDKVHRALAFGLVGAFVFRVMGVAAATFLMRWPALTLVGAGYLGFLSIRHFISPAKRPVEAPDISRAGFWRIVLGIELTDIAFAVDNILAAVALVGEPPPGWPKGAIHPKFWVILSGGMLGVVLTRFSAAACLKLLRRFPRMESSAYLIVLLVALKLILEWAFSNRGLDFEDVGQPACWVFWSVLVICIGVGLAPGRERRV